MGSLTGFLFFQISLNSLVEMWNRWLSVRNILLSEPAVEWGAAIGSRLGGAFILVNAFLAGTEC